MTLPSDFPQNYDPVRWLGEGSVGDVWLAKHKETQGYCAIKTLNVANDTRGSAERSFNREVRAMARLNHPSIIEVFDFGRTPKGSPFVAMENVPGESLARYAGREWMWPQLWGLIDGILNGLSHAHARDLIHRDLKPSNILLIPHTLGMGSVKIVDFGIAVATSDVERARRRIEGTPAYIAPEAAQGQLPAIGPWTDLYSFGVILYEVITGRLPFYGRNLLNHHQHTPPPNLRVRPYVEVPDGLLKIIQKLLEKRPAARYRSVAELNMDLKKLPLPDEIKPFDALEDELEDESYLDFSDEDFTPEPEDILEPLTPMPSGVGVGLFHLRNPPLVGRKDAQQTLEEITQRVLDGYGPQVVLIEGEAGLGKSRLTEWLKIRVEEWGLMQTCMVRSEPQTRGGRLRQAVLRMLGAPLATPQDADQLLSIAFSSQESRDNAREALWPTNLDEDLEGRFQCAARLLRDVSGGRPLLFWADDAHWSPEGRILKLIHMLATQTRLPYLLIATLRPTQRKTVKSVKKALLSLGATQIKLEPISREVLTTSLSALVNLPEGLVELACDQSNGNPLIAVEAVRGYLRDQGIAQAPRDPSEVLRQRIEQASEGPLGGELKSLLARSTLLGRSFTLKTLTRLCGVKGDPQAPLLSPNDDLLHQLIDRAIHAGLIKEQRQRFIYAHDLIRVELREIAQGLPNWSELNLATAELRLVRAQKDPMGIEMEMVARNYWEGDLKFKALSYGQQSLELLMQSGLMGHATSVVRRLLSWNDELQELNVEERCMLHLSGGESATLAGHHAEAEKHIEDAISLARAHDLYNIGARGTSQMGLTMLQADRLDQATHYFQEAQQFLGFCDDPEALCAVHYSLGRWSMAMGEEVRAIEHFEESLQFAMGDQKYLSHQLAARLALAKVTRSQGLIDQAERAFQRINQDATSSNFEVHSLEARLGLGLCAWRKNAPQDALPFFTEVRKAARGNLFFMEFYAAIGEAWAHALQNAWDQAQIALMQAESLRLDVPHRDQELEELRISMKEYVIRCKRLDLLSQLDKLSDLSIAGSTTYQSDHSGR
jgi:eukaryotic-like serine/threonine-protein kinase